ncbi:protein RER1 isoform X1 [Dendrobates tinctorius]|uniref:protein RER1 isoform X1 n=1 Tax=Dendrobates tinctorius TaxID=92724 RepID=UPI003CC95364
MSEGDSIGESVHGKSSLVYRFFSRLGQIYQSWLDKSTPYTAVRWLMTLGLSGLYMIRVYILQGWYIVTYALGIYHLNLFIAFLSPKVDPSLMEDSDEGPSLPTKQNEEFRPFIRRLPEFKFWISCSWRADPLFQVVLLWTPKNTGNRVFSQMSWIIKMFSGKTEMTLYVLIAQQWFSTWNSIRPFLPSLSYGGVVNTDLN